MPGTEYSKTGFCEVEVLIPSNIQNQLVALKLVSLNWTGKVTFPEVTFAAKSLVVRFQTSAYPSLDDRVVFAFQTVRLIS